MPLTYTVTDGVYVVVCDGKVGLDDVRSTFGEIAGLAGVGGSRRILIDDPASDFYPSTAELRELVALWTQMFSEPPTRIALLVDQDIHYGLGRMVSAFIEDKPLRFSVFRDRGEALAWLDQPSR
jgi:hypothetical protein